VFSWFKSLRSCRNEPPKDPTNRYHTVMVVSQRSFDGAGITALNRTADYVATLFRSSQTSVADVTSLSPVRAGESVLYELVFLLHSF
jgi:hypothetical protein